MYMALYMSKVILVWYFFFTFSIKHVAGVVELNDWILDVHWLRSTDQSVGVLSTKVYLLISRTLAS